MKTGIEPIIIQLLLKNNNVCFILCALGVTSPTHPNVMNYSNSKVTPITLLHRLNYNLVQAWPTH